MRSARQCLFIAVVFCAAALSSAFSRGDIPLPPLLPDEQLTYLDVMQKNQFAPALPGPDDSVLLYEQSPAATQRQLWPEDESRSAIVSPGRFNVPYGARIGYSQQYPAKYTSVGTTAGNWLIGPTVALFRHDGSFVSGTLKWPRNDVRAVALPDGSVVIVGGLSWPESRDYSHTLKAERIWLNEHNKIQVEALPALPVDISGTGVWESVWGFSLVHAGNGRVLLAGSEYRNLTLLLEPGANSWRKFEGMKQARTDPALIMLPDGRIWATGGTGAGDSAASTSELWNPATQKWSPGPDLPVPMIDHSAVLTHSNDTVLLAGGYFPTVLGWNMNTQSVFIAAQHAHQRRKAAVVVLPDERLALIGGRYARLYDEAWGRSTPGIAIVRTSIASDGRRAATWPTTHGGALLSRQGHLLAAGGLLRHSHNGSEQELGTRLVERTDCAGNNIATLPPLPVMAGRTQAAWLNDAEVLVHAEASYSDARPQQWLGVINARTGEQRALPLPENGTYFMSDGIHRRMRLIGAHAGRGWLLSEDAQALRVGPHSPVFENAPRLLRKHRDFVGRVLADGRVVVAGGTVESELVASRSEGCKDCEVRYIGYGPLAPSRRHEIFDPVSSTWISSSPSRAAGGPATILADGRVAKLGLFTQPTENSTLDAAATPYGMLEISDREGKTWRALNLPAGVAISEVEGGVGVGIKLLSVQNASEGLQGALFLGAWEHQGTLQWWWLPDVDANSPVWHSLGNSIPPYEFPPGQIDSGIRARDGKQLLLMGGDAGVVACARE